MYTSLLNVKNKISVERKLIDSLKTYLEHESERLRDIRRFYTKVSHLHSEVYKDQTTSMENPLLAFTLIKRLYSEWPNVVYSNEALENAQALRSSYEREGSALPKLEDLQGAAKGLMRLQDVYGLQVAGLVRGHFCRVTNGETREIYKPVVSVPLSGDDCFLVGKVAYDQEDYYHSIQWLEQSVRLFRGVRHEWIPENEGTLEDALDHLAFSHFKTGNVSYALSLSQELLHHDPVNERVLQNVEKYEKLLVVRPHIRSNGLRRPASKYLKTREVYERLCQNYGSHPKHFQNPELFCDYFTSGNPGLILNPVKREVLSLQPYVVLYHDFITDTEAEDIKMLAQLGVVKKICGGKWRETRYSRLSHKQQCMAEGLPWSDWETGPADLAGNWFECEPSFWRVPSSGELWDWRSL